MIRVVVFVVAVALAACMPNPALPPTPAQLSADTVRATLIAALIDAPPETLQVVRHSFPRGYGRTASAIMAFTVDRTGKPMPETMTILSVEGDSGFARETCGSVPELRFAPPPSGGPTLMLVPFVTFREGSPPPEGTTTYREMKEKLENMSTVDRRAFLLDKGCRLFRGRSF